MTRHSKNCTAHTVYTYHERQKDARRFGFGTQTVRLGKDSVTPLNSCCLSLQVAKDPVVTADGYLYDRAVILEYIVTQKAEYKRKLKLYEKQKAREEADKKEQIKAEKEENAKRFLSMNTLETHAKLSAQEAEAEALASISTKRTNPKISCFWVSTPTDRKIEREILTKPDPVVRCPMSGNPLVYKNLVSVNFTKFDKDSDVLGNAKPSSSTNGDTLYCCCVSRDPLTNATDCVVLKTSGSVVTKEVVDKIIRKDMVDPINGKKLKEEDLISIQKGSLGFADERSILTAKRVRPCMQT